ncbi:ribulose-1,5-biphosphate synthetase [Ignicoccus islandicus DSM 13165]|uniref:Thiamine thiazole synthase n=1 Tax=Ignicoccus islandicus DSM 13165 TaxID=940295 RepID=A0A0U3F2V2_9CREN|nr:sulfide-dependent adenosine diphosphate thiazole synthase [Ignicoccus islandicus]ALU11861.1 ribulose-1,5-biphosphate synthetase [Ignicoccus islandicus DSM 13165]
MIDEGKVTSIIIEESSKELSQMAKGVDVVIVGAGPAGLTASHYLAKAGLKVLILERRVSLGGGISGGGSLFHKVVVEDVELEGYNPKEIAEELGVPLKKVDDNLYTTDAAALVAKLSNASVSAGAKIVLGMHVEDLIYRIEEGVTKVKGVVALWSPIYLSGLHVDPIFFKAKAVVDATGHDAEILKIASKKLPNVNFEVGREYGAWIDEAEKLVVKYTGKVLEGLYAAGMSVASFYRLPRMGPVFGGMLASGKKVAEKIIGDLEVS